MESGQGSGPGVRSPQKHATEAPGAAISGHPPNQSTRGPVPGAARDHPPNWNGTAVFMERNGDVAVAGTLHGAYAGMMSPIGMHNPPPTTGPGTPSQNAGPTGVPVSLLPGARRGGDNSSTSMGVSAAGMPINIGTAVPKASTTSLVPATSANSTTPHLTPSSAATRAGVGATDGPGPMGHSARHPHAPSTTRGDLPGGGSGIPASMMASAATGVGPTGGPPPLASAFPPPMGLPVPVSRATVPPPHHLTPALGTEGAPHVSMGMVGGGGGMPPPPFPLLNTVGGVSGPPMGALSMPMTMSLSMPLDATSTTAAGSGPGLLGAVGPPGANMKVRAQQRVAAFLDCVCVCVPIVAPAWV